MTALKLWLITQDANDSYDTYDSAVVVAVDEDDARRIHPDGSQIWFENRGWVYALGHAGQGRGWTVPENVKAELVGMAADDLGTAKVICASYNAG